MLNNVLIALFATQGLMIQPPMHRVATCITGERTQVLGLREGVALYLSRNRAGALALDNCEVKWETKHEDWTQNVCLGEAEMFATTSGMKLHQILAWDIATGKRRVVRSIPEGATEIAWRNGTLFLLTPSRVIEAIDPASGKTLGSVPLDQTGKGSHMDEMTLCGDVLLVALDDQGWVSVDPDTRRILWTKPAKYATLERPAEVPGGVLVDQPHLMLVDPRTGEARWERDGLELEYFGVTGSVLIGEADDALVVLDLATGKTLHQMAGGRPGFSVGGGRTLLATSEGVLVMGDEVRCIDREGKVLWSSKPFFSGDPEITEKGRLLCNDGDRLLIYSPGEPLALPESQSERDALAVRWAREFEILDEVERETFGKLGDVAADALIARFVEWASESERQWNSEGNEDDRGMLRYRLLEKASRMLDTMCGPNQTDALTRAVASMGQKSSYRGTLVRLLGTHGRQQEVMAAYVSSLRKELHQPTSRSRDDSMIQMVARSKDPQAVAFMIEVLSNPKAPNDWKKEAFVHLAGTGGTAGIEAVLAARDRRRPRMRWEDRIDVAVLNKREILGEAKDSKGTTWRLFHASALGNGSDLFVSARTSRGWSKPLFTGVFTAKTWHLSAPTTYRGVPMSRLLKTDWIKLFPTDATMRKDTDRDGLTDLVERRLGTDPAKSDTDADGLGDAVDPCPNAAPRTMGDKEKIVAACVEARFYLEDWGVPAVLEVEGVEPFEMYGYRRPLLWVTPAYDGVLPKMYGTGMNTLGFHSEREGDPPIQIDPDGKTARTLISRYSGGLNGDGIAVTLIKVGQEWFVTDMQMMYVS